MVGRKLGHYEIVEEISRGGMGVVYRAVDLSLGREVAIKVLPEALLHDPDRRSRLLHEARAASALEHPHIAVIHAVGEDQGVTFIAMELIRGEKLSDLLARGPLPPARALALATEVAEALSRAHEKGLVHRDLKPANVMITGDGHVKVIDFGLAKLLEPVAQEAATASLATPRTDAGIVLGTAAYMSPEQARGTRVDHRSDVFALGVTLYEMMTGRPAFTGQSSLDTMQAVLTQPVPPLPALAGSTAEVTGELQRIIAKATAKDPDDRFQGMKDLIVDLRGARRRLESTPTSGTVATPAAPATQPLARRNIAVAAFVSLAVALAALAWLLAGRRADAPPAGPDGKPAVAVLYFENNTGDPSLDWMRTGLTDMMVTDLSQSPEFEVLGTDRLVQILQELRRADDRVLPADVVQEVAARAGVTNVLVGSYVKAGNTIRISARLQDAQTGRIVKAERVEGQGEASLFGLVDELTQRFRTTMAAARAAATGGSLLKRPGEAPDEAGLDRGLTDITTTSIEAYRYYAEAMSYHERGLPAQAAPLLEKAVEIDPDFAMAYAKLAVVHNNLFSYDKRDYYGKRALDLSGRLTTRERYYIEGFYYTLRPETTERGLEAYRQGLKLHPEHQASRHNLALELRFLERYPEAIEHYEELVRRRTSNPSSYANLADALVQTGNQARARQVVEGFVARHPENASGYRALGAVNIADGRFDEARAAFQQSEALNPLDFGARLGQRLVALLERRWDEAAAVGEKMAGSNDPFQRYLGHAGDAFLASARGRGVDLLKAWDSAASGPVPNQVRAFALTRRALSLLRQRRPEAALVDARRALEIARDTEDESEALQMIAIAQAAAGKRADAQATLERLAALVAARADRPTERRLHWARGEVALALADSAGAAAELTRAAALLSMHGPPVGPPSAHGDLWFSTAMALVAAGRDGEAEAMLERLQHGHERAFAMDAWARSFYLLGQIYERRGNMSRAREQYAQFVELWGEGDLERAWVEEARRKLEQQIRK